MVILDKVEKTIDGMRQALYETIEQKNSLLDSEVLAASKRLDNMLNEYNELIEKLK